MIVAINDLRMHVETVGSGTPLVVLHGFTGAGSNWRPFFDSWGQHLRVIAPDLIGHGQTDAPMKVNRYSMDQAAKDLDDLLDNLGVKNAHLLGYSMGGRLALTYAVRYPGRIASLLLESSSPGIATESERKNRIKRDERLAEQIEQVGVEAFVNEWEKLPLFSTQTKEAREQLRTQRLQNRSFGLANSLRGMGTGAQTPLWDELGSLDVPVKLLVGEKDHKFCEIAKDMAHHLLDGQMIKVSNAGHTIHVERLRFFDKMVMELVY